MPKSTGRQDAVREPRQARSQKRVEQIFDASKQLILEKGCAALKMSDIAAAAEISIGSIYQYFPNKQAIVAALATHYLEVFREDAIKALGETPDDLDALWRTAMKLHDAYYRMHREDPVVRDIWMGSATDKALQEVIEHNQVQSVDLFFELSRHLFKPGQRKKIKRIFALFIDFGQIAVTRSVAMNDKDGERNNELTKELLSACWAGSVKPLALAGKRR